MFVANFKHFGIYFYFVWFISEIAAGEFFSKPRNISLTPQKKGKPPPQNQSCSSHLLLLNKFPYVEGDACHEVTDLSLIHSFFYKNQEILFEAGCS